MSHKNSAQTRQNLQCEPTYEALFYEWYAKGRAPSSPSLLPYQFSQWQPPSSRRELTREFRAPLAIGIS
jgi:hypothetical protein